MTAKIQKSATLINMDNQIYNDIKAAFDECYSKKISPRLKKFENKRVFSNNYFFNAILPIGVIIFLLIVGFCIICIEKVDMDFLGNVLFYTVAILIFIYKKFEKNVELDIKAVLMSDICKVFGDLKWSTYYNGVADEFYNIGLVDYYNYSEFDDYFWGTYKNVLFEIIEADFTRGMEPIKKNRIPVFDGIILKIKLPDKFKTHTLILPDSSSKSPIKNLKRTELEDVVFEKKYNVYTDDEIESRVLITPAFMERLNNIENVFKTKNTYCCFKDRNLYIGLKTNKDMFKLCSLDKELCANFFYTLFDEIISIYKLIDYLKLIK